MTKYNTFDVLLGKLGHLPGGYDTPGEEEFIFDELSRFEKDSSFLEVGSATGRTTVLLCKAAENAGGKVSFVPEMCNQAAFTSAMQLFECSNIQGIDPGSKLNYDALVVNAEQVPQESLDKLLEDNNYGRAYFYKLGSKIVPFDKKDLKREGQFTVWGK
jgi:hypothetical protein